MKSIVLFYIPFILSIACITAATYYTYWIGNRDLGFILFMAGLAIILALRYTIKE